MYLLNMLQNIFVIQKNVCMYTQTQIHPIQIVNIFIIFCIFLKMYFENIDIF